MHHITGRDKEKQRWFLGAMKLARHKQETVSGFSEDEAKVALEYLVLIMKMIIISEY